MFCIATVVTGQRSPRPSPGGGATSGRRGSTSANSISSASTPCCTSPWRGPSTHPFGRAVGSQPGQRPRTAGAGARRPGARAARPARRRVVPRRAARRPGPATRVIEARLGGLDPAARDCARAVGVVPAGRTRPARGGRRPRRAGGPRARRPDRAPHRRPARDGALAHPLHGEVLRAGMPALRRRSILLDQAAAVEAWGADGGRTRCASLPGGWRRRAGPTRDCCCGPPVWRATTTTSGGRQVGRGRRSSPSGRPPPGWCSASRSTTSARSMRPRRCWPRPPSGRPATTRSCGSRPCGDATCSGAAGATPKP